MLLLLLLPQGGQSGRRGAPGEAPGGSTVGESQQEAGPRRPRRPAESGPPRAASATGPPASDRLGERGS